MGRHLATLKDASSRDWCKHITGAWWSLMESVDKNGYCIFKMRGVDLYALVTEKQRAQTTAARKKQRVKLEPGTSWATPIDLDAMP